MIDFKQNIKAGLRRIPWMDRWIRLYLLRRRANSTSFPNWSAVLTRDGAQWSRFLGASRGGPRVLVATSTGGFSAGVTMESLLAASLTVRGAEVDVLLCDHLLPACLQCELGLYPRLSNFVRHGPSRDLCGVCYAPGAKLYGDLQFPIRRLSTFVLPEEHEECRRISGSVEVDQIPSYRWEGLSVGEHAAAGALRFFARADLRGVDFGEAVLRRYFEAALLTATAVRRLVRQERYEAAVFHHGIYVPQGLTGEVCRQEGVRVVNWNPGYRKKTFIFSHGDTYHHTLMDEPVEKWERMAWSSDMERKILDYLQSRWHGGQDWIWFHERPQEEIAAISREVGVDFSRPCVGLLTNVMWDAQLHYPANVFPNMRAWVMETIRYFAGRPDLQLLIRVHPAEIRGTLPTRQPIVEEIRSEFSELPSNVFVVPPESQVSTYAAMAQCNAAIIYGTKAGVELTSMGIPVIVAGEAWIRNKGVTRDAQSVDHYYELLGELPYTTRMDEAAIQRSRMYAFHFFLRRMIPVDCTEPAAGNPPFRLALDSIGDIVPGRSPGLDVICDGILRGTDFIYLAEQELTTSGAGS